MNRFDPAHPTDDDAFDQKLAAAFHDVDVPDGLKTRLLDAVAGPVTKKTLNHNSIEHPRVSRRRWLAGGFAAGVSGLGLWGSYHWASRSLTEEDVWRDVSQSLVSRDWTAFKRGSRAPYPFPKELMVHTGWQVRPTAIDREAVAFNLTREGVPAVLFVIRTDQAASFPALRQAKPLVQTGEAARDWNHTAIWRDKSSTYLYVLAYNGRREDFDRFFGGRTVPFA